MISNQDVKRILKQPEMTDEEAQKVLRDFQVLAEIFLDTFETVIKN